MATDRPDASSASAARVLADVTRIHARARPDQIALVFEGRSTTFGELDRRARQVANGLLRATSGPTARVALLDTNADSFFELFFGCAKANHVLVPINWRLAPPEIAAIVNDAAAEVLFVGAEFIEVVDTIRGDLPTVSLIVALNGREEREGQEGLEGLEGQERQIGVHDHPEAESLRSRPRDKNHGQARGGGAPRAVKERWHPYVNWRDRQSPADPVVAVDGSDVALLMYTSGTSGQPKGAQLTNDNILSLGPTLIEMCGTWSQREVSLVCLPLFHVGGSLWGVVCLYSGATNVVVRHIIPAEILRTIAAYRVTKTLLIPAVIRLLLLTPGIEEADLSSLDLIVYGASPAPAELLRRAIDTFKCGFGQVYGLTETSGAITYLPPADHDGANIPRLQSCGKPLRRAEIRVVDTQGRDLPPGEVGEIICRTPQLMKGYWNLPDPTAAALRDGWLRTGDAGYFDADGYLYVHDRINDMIVTGGENVYPAEVENAIRNHPAVSDVAVFGVPDEDWGEAVRAVVVRKPNAEATPDAIIASVKKQIAGYKAPKTVDFADTLPRTATGKVLRRSLREPFWAGRERQIN
jgi:long-chain acyl-CoA synthetase